MKGVNVTRRLIQHKNAPMFAKTKEELDSLIDFIFYHVSMPRLEVEVFFAVKLKQADELLVEHLFYQTDLLADNLAILDAYAAICQGKPVEAIDRLSSKEIDFYLRDDAKVASFDFYPPELYDILAAGEELKKIAFGKEAKIEKPHLDTSLYGEFNELSYSEQLELVEDVLGEYYFSRYPKLAGRLICDQLETDTLEFNLDTLDSNVKTLKDLEREVVELLSFHLQLKVKVKIKILTQRQES